MLYVFKMARFYILFTYTVPSRALSLKLTSLFTEVRPREKREGFTTRDGENRLVHVRSFPREKEIFYRLLFFSLIVNYNTGRESSNFTKIEDESNNFREIFEPRTLRHDYI